MSGRRGFHFRLVMMAQGVVVASVVAHRLVANGPAAVESPSPALAEYVAKPDDSYRWQKRREGALGAGSYVELTLTSQTWRDTVWKHQLFIYRPSTVDAHAEALLLVAGGSRNDALDKAPADRDSQLPREARLVANLADSMRTPVAVLLQVPNQPLFDGKVEDEIISFTFEKFLQSGDVQWPLLLPMVKSVVRAMDAVQEFADSEWQLDVERFLVTGASKRGWTTWLTGAVDPRVTAIAPMVIDMLNMAEHMELQRLSYGTASEQIRDYTQKGLHEHLRTERGSALRAMVDPYSYRRQLLMPKLIILGTNDRYWPVDALNLYWSGLEGEKHVLYVPNNGHGLRDYPRILGAVVALHKSLNGGGPLPKFEWAFQDAEDGARLELSTDQQPASVTAWTAAAQTRDFRSATWVARPAQSAGDDGRTFAATLPTPRKGYAALFAEVRFDLDGQPLPLYLSTTMRLVEAENASPAGK